MGILDRISGLIKSNLNAAIDHMSDPEKEIDQLILDMEEQVRRAQKEVRTTLANEKLQRQRVEELERSAASWEDRATRAVGAGDDALAKEALKRKAQVETE